VQQPAVGDRIAYGKKFRRLRVGAWAASIRYAGGLRISELEKVRLAELQADGAVIRLRNTKTKAGLEERRVA
jgi:integrase